MGGFNRYPAAVISSRWPNLAARRRFVIEQAPRSAEGEGRGVRRPGGESVNQDSFLGLPLSRRPRAIFVGRPWILSFRPLSRPTTAIAIDPRARLPVVAPLRVTSSRIISSASSGGVSAEETATRTNDKARQPEVRRGYSYSFPRLAPS